MGDDAAFLADYNKQSLAMQKRWAKAEKRKRLEREVIKAARQWHPNDKGFTRIALHQAVAALLAFESDHREGK